MHRKFLYIAKFRYDSEISLSEEELIKTESFGSQKYDADNFAMHRKFRYIVKFRYHSENFAIIAKFCYIAKFQPIAEISLYRKISLS